MKDVIYLLFDLLTTLAKLLRPGGSRTVIAENLLLKQQLIIHSRSRQRAPNLTTQDRTILGFLSLFLFPKHTRGVSTGSIINPRKNFFKVSLSMRHCKNISILTNGWKEIFWFGTMDEYCIELQREITHYHKARNA